MHALLYYLICIWQGSISCLCKSFVSVTRIYSAKCYEYKENAYCKNYLAYHFVLASYSLILNFMVLISIFNDCSVDGFRLKSVVVSSSNFCFSARYSVSSFIFGPTFLSN